jgi:hypothetical protein
VPCRTAAMPAAHDVVQGANCLCIDCRVHTRGEEALGLVSLNITGCPKALPASGPTSGPASGPASSLAPAPAATSAATGEPGRPDAAAGPPPPLSAFCEAVGAAVAALAARVTALPLSVPLVS